jgi:hypothetical protein
VPTEVAVPLKPPVPLPLQHELSAGVAGEDVVFAVAVEVSGGGDDIELGPPVPMPSGAVPLSQPPAPLPR